MDKSKALIILSNDDARRAVASGGRISTTEGTALKVFDKSGDAEKDIKLIKKVLSSGHKSVLEHHSFTIAFDEVSVLVEQYMIEHRLAAYTVKSRRYVDYSNAGYLIPEGLSVEALEKYKNKMDSLFDLYGRLVESGVPKEDARFVLPYSFRSNFYMTVNGRELVRLMSEMLYGRLSHLPEMARLGGRLKEQFEKIYPGIPLDERQACELADFDISGIKAGAPKEGKAELVYFPENACDLLENAVRFSGRFEGTDEKDVMKLIKDARARELEFIHAQFIIRNVSLACVTHFTRHRILSLLVPDAKNALTGGGYVLPATVKNSELCDEYKKTFEEYDIFVKELLESGFDQNSVGYLALAGQQIDIMLDMNGRELLHFFKLRTCNRAQWEIRRIARDMLSQLDDKCDDIFFAFGPSCKVDGRCPEGRLSCGKPQ